MGLDKGKAMKKAKKKEINEGMKQKIKVAAKNNELDVLESVQIEMQAPSFGLSTKQLVTEQLSQHTIFRVHSPSVLLRLQDTLQRLQVVSACSVCVYAECRVSTDVLLLSCTDI